MLFLCFSLFIYIKIFFRVVSRIIRERKKERDKIVIFSSSFYCLYFIFQFENKKSLEGKKKIYLNIILMFRIYMLGKTYLYVVKQSLSPPRVGEFHLRKSKHGGNYAKFARLSLLSFKHILFKV
jgi:hypothetical protein